MTVRVFASTAVPETWTVSTGGCAAGDSAGCSDSRGGLFSPNASTTWDHIDKFALGVELNLRNYSSNQDYGEYGFDILALGYQGSGSPSVNHSVIAGIETDDFYVGNIGLSPQPINFTTVDNPPPSLLSQLKSTGQIPSLSYGYSAGAPYRLKKVLGSLTLGGYDTSRFTPPNTLNFTFADDISRDLVVGLQAVEFNGPESAGRNLLPEGILAFIDSTIPHIWLPLDACQAFERAFGLIYDNATDLYLVNSTLHDRLKGQNASVSFILGNAIQGGETVNITFPYASFDLQVSSPIVSQPTRYFPLRRAENDTQYTLGRTFLQESYLTVDYERSKFSVSQAAFVDDTTSNLVAILSPDNTSTTTTASKRDSGRMSTGALAGAIVGVIMFCLLVIGAVSLLLWRRRRMRKDKEVSMQQANKEAENNRSGSGSIPIGELNVEFGDGRYRPPEVEGSPGLSGRLAEAEGNHGVTEVEGTKAGVEMEGSGGIAEMEGKGKVQELDAVHVYELPAEDVDSRVARSESGQERIERARLAGLRSKRHQQVKDEAMEKKI
ncbi:MAG: hypothetical protein Q9201_005747 [Fulgogasparrea decipioides]